jgi:hypothetical protein
MQNKEKKVSINQYLFSMKLDDQVDDYDDDKEAPRNNCCESFAWSI